MLRGGDRLHYSSSDSDRVTADGAGFGANFTSRIQGRSMTIERPRTSESSQGESSMGSRQWGFIGAGKMATALVRGMIRAGLAQPDAISASDPVAAVRGTLAAETGIIAHASNLAVVEGCDVLVLAVKPQAMAPVLGRAEAGGRLRPPGHLHRRGRDASRRLTAGLGEMPRIVRVMPNTPALVGEGVSAYCPGARRHRRRRGRGAGVPRVGRPRRPRPGRRCSMPLRDCRGAVRRSFT